MHLPSQSCNLSQRHLHQPTEALEVELLNRVKADADIKEAVASRLLLGAPLAFQRNVETKLPDSSFHISFSLSRGIFTSQALKPVLRSKGFSWVDSEPFRVGHLVNSNSWRMF